MSSRFSRWWRFPAVGLGLVVLAGGFWATSAQEAEGGRASGTRLDSMKTSRQWSEGRFRNSLARLPKPGQTIAPGMMTRTSRWWPAVPWRTAEDAPVVSTGLEQRPDVVPIGNRR